MTDDAIRSALRESVADVLEKMFFVEAQEGSGLAEPGEEPPAEEMAVRVKFHGTPPGCFGLRLSSAAAREIAGNFLGLDAEEVSRQQISEVACELANMVCGSVLSRVESTTAFRLEAPQVAPLEEQCPAAPDIRLGVAVSGGRLTANLTLDTARCLNPAPSVY